MFDFNKQLNAIMNNQQTLNTLFGNLQNFATPGYKASGTSFQEMVNQSMGSGAGSSIQTTNVQFGEGKIMPTGGTGANGTPMDLAIQGNGFFSLSDGKSMHFTRGGRFHFKDGKLSDPTSGMKVMGYALDENGAPTGKLSEISLSMDPNTRLYGGKYTGFRFDSGGKLYGESRFSDPLTGQSMVSVTPLYQVGVSSFANPSGLRRTGTTTFAASENSGKPVVGVSGQGALGQVVAGALEMSNIDMGQQVSQILMARQNYEANFSAFKAMDRMTDQAIGLIK
ncbi:MAG: flagellar hook basal-body protein [Armatimonadetes bacterium]|nr:flagellar hook basal-body protein [Armatimonadota bacterium]